MMEGNSRGGGAARRWRRKKEQGCQALYVGGHGGHGRGQQKHHTRASESSRASEGASEGAGSAYCRPTCERERELCRSMRQQWWGMLSHMGDAWA
jgi:hypothetical protein